MAENKKIITVETLGAYTEEVKKYVGSQVDVKADKTTVEGLSTSVDGIAGDVADIKSSIEEMGEGIEGINTELAKKASTEYVNGELAKKVDVEGYVAFTSEEKAKLAGIAESANNFELPEGTVIDANYASRMSALEGKPFDTYATKTEVSNVDAKFAGYYTKEEIEDKKYLAAADVSNKAEKSEVEAVSGEVTKVSNRVAAIENDYLKATDKTELEGKINTAEANAKAFATKEVSDFKDFLMGEGAADTIDTIKNLSDALKEHQDEYGALVAEVNKKANSTDVYSKTEADSTFLKSHQDISHLATKAEVSGEIERLDGEIGGLESSKADKTQLNSYYTKEEADGKFLTAHQDISGKADKSYVDGLVETINDDINALEGRMGNAEGALATVDSRISAEVSDEASRVDGLMAAETTRVNGELDKKLNISDLVYATSDEVKNLF